MCFLIFAPNRFHVKLMTIVYTSVNPSFTTVMTLSFRTDWSEQTVQTQIRLLLEEQSDQGLHCLLCHLHHFDKVPEVLASLFEF